MADKSKRPIKLEIEVRLAESKDDALIVLKHEKKTNQTQNDFNLPEILKGNVSCRRESKGRGGRTVCILHDFSEHSLRSKEALKILCSRLKNLLACGGTVEESTLIIQIDDTEKLTKILNSWGLKVKRTGG